MQPIKRQKIIQAARAGYGNNYVIVPARSRRANNNLNNLRLAGYLGLERKFVDAQLTSTALTTAMSTAILDPTTTSSLCGIAQGDGPSNRDGKQVKMSGLYIRGKFRMPSNEGNQNPFTGCIVRYGVVRDKQTNGAQCAGNVVFDATPTSDWQSFNNLEYSKRFDILYDKTVKLNINTMSQNGVDNFSMGDWVYPFKINLPFINDQVNYLSSATTGVIASITDVSYHFFAIVSSDTFAPTVDYAVRARFYG